MRAILVVWAGLMVLLALTLASAFVPLGAGNAAVNLLVAVGKTALVALFFMHLHRSIPLLRLIALVGLFTLGVLFAISGADFVSRHIQRSAWQHAQYSSQAPPGPPDQSVPASGGPEPGS